MNLFNYLAVMTSLILGLGLARLLAGIGNLLQVRQHIRFYWLHGLWLLVLGLYQVHLWWSFWGLRESITWNLGKFLYALIGPAGLLIASHIAIPGEYRGEGRLGGLDLGHHYDDTSPVFFGILAGTAAWGMFLEPAMGLRRIMVGFRLLQLLGLVNFGACAISKSRALHTVAAFVAVAILAAVMVLGRFQPVAGGLAR